MKNNIIIVLLAIILLVLGLTQYRSFPFYTWIVQLTPSEVQEESPNATKLQSGKVLNTNIASNEKHSYAIYLGNEPVYYLFWEDADIMNTNGLADIKVGVRKASSDFYHSRIDITDQGTFGVNRHRMLNLKSTDGSASAFRFEPNNWYIVDVEPFEGSQGEYRIVFY